MSAKAQIIAKKVEYMKRFVDLLENYSRAVLVTVDNIGSHHMQKNPIGPSWSGCFVDGKEYLDEEGNQR